jgi:hypothetical protein
MVGTNIMHTHDVRMYWIECSRNEAAHPSLGSAERPHVGGILADVMGLGKTIDGLGIVYYDIFSSKKRQPLETTARKSTLVVAPLTLLHHWQQEAVGRLQLNEEDVMIYQEATLRISALM